MNGPTLALRRWFQGFDAKLGLMVFGMFDNTVTPIQLSNRTQSSNVKATMHDLLVFVLALKLFSLKFVFLFRCKFVTVNFLVNKLKSNSAN